VHLARKAFHASGIVIVALYRILGVPREAASWILVALVAALAAVDFARSRLPAVQALFATSFRAILDPKDMRGLNGSTLYFAGCGLTVALFPPDVACAGILALALGDSSAAIVGASVRSPRFGRVSLAGSLACFAAALLGCALFVPLPRAVLGGVAAAVIEAAAGTKLDNLVIPVGAALAMHLA
jgi:dolichol kinase